MTEVNEKHVRSLPPSIAAAAHLFLEEIAGLAGTESNPSECAELATIAAVASEHADAADALGSGYEAHSAFYHGLADAYSVAAGHCIDAISTLP